MNRFVKVKYVLTCAHCGREKGEVNHWFLVQPGKGVIYSVNKIPEDGLEKLFDNEFPACGEECLMKLESRIIRGDIELKEEVPAWNDSTWKI